MNETHPRNQANSRQGRQVRRNDTEESPDIEGSETDRLVRVILPNQQRTDEKAADPEECIYTQIPVFRNGANNGGMGEKYKPPVEADHSNDSQSTPAVQSGYVGGKARAFCHLLLNVPCPGTHTIHPDGERTVVAWTSQLTKLATWETYCPAKIRQILAYIREGGNCCKMQQLRE